MNVHANSPKSPTPQASPPASVFLRLLSILAYVVMLVGIVGLWMLHSLFSAALWVIVPQVAASALILWARITFGRRSFHFAANPTAGGLVTSGPYQYLRHPIYTGICIITIPAVAAHFSLAALACGTLIWSAALIRMLCEERLVRTQYPEYAGYAAKTARMIPHIF